ncbi:hypothetical protein NLO98_20310 [Pseudomonas syringae]|nr:hypothetical protein [Pseudomonas syringae]
MAFTGAPLTITSSFIDEKFLNSPSCSMTELAEIAAQSSEFPPTKIANAPKAQIGIDLLPCCINLPSHQ